MGGVDGSKRVCGREDEAWSKAGGGTTVASVTMMATEGNGDETIFGKLSSTDAATATVRLLVGPSSYLPFSDRPHLASRSPPFAAEPISYQREIESHS